MKHSSHHSGSPDVEPVRVLGRGLRAARGVHLTLRTMREAVGKTQLAVAEASQINQSDISRLESRRDFDDCQVATLRRYLAALGGQLELVAKFGDKRLILAGLETPDTLVDPASKALRRKVRKSTGRAVPSDKRI